ncbi:MAG TPA: hypothetical protein VF489_03755 [Sphingobium sp.]
MSLGIFVGCLLAVNSTTADASSGTGKGFDCLFHVMRGKLERVAVWYGSMKAGHAASAKVQDNTHVFLVGSESPKKQPEFRVLDKWPASFTLNYFGPGRTGLATSLISVWGDGDRTENLAGEIALLASNKVADGEEIQASKRYKGLCSVNNSVDYDTFIAGLQS